MAEPEFVERLGLGSHEMISLVGGGGKTTTLFELGNQLDGRVILTTTTRMGSDQTSDHPRLVAPSIDVLDQELDRHGTVLVWSSVEAHKAVGVSPEEVDEWFDMADHVVVEADGSRRKPFKAPGDHEPVIPSRTTLVCVVMGIRALGEPIAEVCHRPERVAALAICEPADVLTPERAARVITHTEGGMRNVPDGARALLIVTGVGADNLATARRLAEIVEPSLSDVLLVDLAG